MARLPQQHRSRARVERILAAATAILADVDRPATLRAVASRAGVAPASVYQFFENMEAVRAAVRDRASALLAEALRQGGPATVAGDPRQLFAALIDTIDAMQQAHPELGCMVRPTRRSAFAEGLVQELRVQVRAHVARSLSPADRAAPNGLAMAGTVLLALLEQTPPPGSPGRAAYLQKTAALAAAALDES